MSNITCRSCGKRYDYLNSDLCPHCGAYNKPTSRLRVDFNEEGSAELLHEQEFLRRSEAGQKREKACYERKECHEDKVRQKGRTVQSGSLNTEQLAAKLREFGSQSGARFAAKKEKKAACFFAKKQPKSGKQKKTKACVIDKTMLYCQMVYFDKWGRGKPAPREENTWNIR